MKTRYLLILIPFLTSLLSGCKEFFVLLSGDQVDYTIIKGTVWEDTNVNGRREFGEPFLDEIKVGLLKRDKDGVWQEEYIKYTDNKGYYVFDNLPEGGDYQVKVFLKDGYSFSNFYDPNTEDGKDGDSSIPKDLIDIIYTRIFPQTGLSPEFYGTEDVAMIRIADAGMMWTSVLVPANEPPTGADEAPEPISEPPPAGTDQYWAFDDDDDDVVVCGGGYVSDPEVDLTSIDMTRIEDQYSTVVSLSAPLKNMDSFAVIIEVEVEIEEAGDTAETVGKKVVKRAFIYELHNGIYKIGEIDPATGNLLAIQPEDVTVELKDGRVLLTFDVKPTDTVKTIFVKSFHLLEGTVHCDDTEVFELN